MILNRPAKKNVKGKRFQSCPDEHRFPCGMLWSNSVTGGGKVLAEWMLLTNASKCVHTEHLARCYYWRWCI